MSLGMYLLVHMITHDSRVHQSGAFQMCCVEILP